MVQSTRRCYAAASSPAPGSHVACRLAGCTMTRAQPSMPTCALVGGSLARPSSSRPAAGPDSSAANGALPFADAPEVEASRCLGESYSLAGVGWFLNAEKTGGRRPPAPNGGGFCSAAHGTVSLFCVTSKYTDCNWAPQKSGQARYPLARSGAAGTGAASLTACSWQGMLCERPSDTASALRNLPPHSLGVLPQIQSIGRGDSYDLRGVPSPAIVSMASAAATSSSPSSKQHSSLRSPLPGRSSRAPARQAAAAAVSPSPCWVPAGWAPCGKGGCHQCCSCCCWLQGHAWVGRPCG
jgi:hypothetical protein